MVFHSVQETRVHDIDERLQHVCHDLQQESLIDDTIDDQWTTRLRACLSANGAQFEHYQLGFLCIR